MVSRFSSALCIWLASLLNTINYTIVIPTSVNYMAELHLPEVLGGVVVGLFALSKALTSVPMSCLIAWVGLRPYFLLTCVAQALGSVLYALAGSFGGWPLAAVGRILVGAFGGQLLTTSFTAKAYNKDERTRAMIWMQSAQIAACVLGPFLGGLLSFLCNLADLHGVVRSNTAPGWFMACCTVLLLGLVIFAFQDADGAQQGNGHGAGTLPYGGLAVGFFMVFSLQALVGSWELHTSTVSQESWKWSVFGGASLTAAVMLLGIPATIVYRRLAKRERVTDRSATCSLAPLFLFFSLFFWLFPLPRVIRYTVGSVALVLYTQVAAACNTSLTTKMVPDSRRQSVVGVIALLSALGRATGPMLATVEANTWGCIVSGVALCQVIALTVCFRRLVEADPAVCCEQLVAPCVAPADAGSQIGPGDAEDGFA